MRHNVAINIVCWNEKKLKCKSKKKRIWDFFACFRNSLVRKTAQFHVFQFWSASSNSVTEWLSLALQKQVASILFTVLYSFMANFTDLRQVNLSVEHLYRFILVIIV